MLGAFSVLFTLLVPAWTYQLLPPGTFAPSSNASSKLDFQALEKVIYLETAFGSVKDVDGLTLIPPSASEFAETFRQDLERISGSSWTIETVDELPTSNAIWLGGLNGSSTSLAYENGVATSEAYELDISSNGVSINGVGARGMFWGTRTLIQLLMLNGTSLTPGRLVDAPAYATRGFMLDAGRKWYSPSFLKELCTYASFFKMSEFHYHTSDNYPLNRGHNETWNKVYSHFSLMPENDELKPLVNRPNETLSRADFEDLQSHCAQRGVTIIPEIEAPGHCLSITKWKPELALSKKDLLNLTHPDSIPTVKSIWDEFLPWFQTKQVHIGADEYDSDLADDYIRFVNEMAEHINATAQKRIRIWGTYEPSENLTISKDVIIQHWQYGQSDPVQLDEEGYNLINSQDWWAYMSLKNDHMPISPAPYPQFFNESRVLNFANQPSWQWNPALFNPVNKTEQLESSSQKNMGAILAAWNDNGPDATTQLEAYYAIRRGIPLVAARAWAGSRGPTLDPQLLDPTIDFLSPRIPGQNLDRTIAPESTNTSTSLLSWTRPATANETITLGHGSRGMNYSLSISATAPFQLSSNDTTLSLDASGSLIFTADGWPYPLRSVGESDGFDPGQPGRIWVNVTSSSHTPINVSLPAEITIKTDVLGGSRVWLNGTFAGRFEVFVFGGRNTQFSWSQMAFVAPLETLSGAGGVSKLSLSADASSLSAGSNTTTTPSGTGLPGAANVARPSAIGTTLGLCLCLALLAMI